MYRDYTNIPVDYVDEEAAFQVIHFIKLHKPEYVLPDNHFYVRRRLALAFIGLKISSENIELQLMEKGYPLADQLISFLNPDHSELFRDADMWKLLEEILRKLSVQNRRNILVASTTRGEELYSLIILLHEIGLASFFNISIEGPSDWALNCVMQGEMSNFKIRSSLLNLKNVVKDSELSKYTTSKNNVYSFRQEYLKEIKIESSIQECYDLILFRNKTLQLSPQDTVKCYNKYKAKLSHQGLLMLGNVENMSNVQACNLIAVKEMENVFQKEKNE